MNIIPKIRTRYGENVGIEIFISPPLLSDNNRTFISTDAASGATSFSVDNGLKFALSQYTIVGQPGAEKSEIVQLHASTSPTAILITLAAASNFAHNRGERIAFIPYNQIVIERSVDGGVTYSPLATIGIRADSTETYYQHATGVSTDYYRAKFSNSSSSDVSQYSDGIIGTGFTDASAGNLFREALVSLGEQIHHNDNTKQFLITALNEGRDELDKFPGIERWSFRTAFDYAAGSAIPGQYTLNLPADYRESNTFKNLLSVRIGRDNLPLTKVDKNALNRWYKGVAKTTLNGSITTASTSIILTKSGDFDDSGSIYIQGESVSDVVDVVSYTGNTRSSNTLTGVTAITANHASGGNVFQGASFGYPLEYTVYEGKIVFSQPFNDNMKGRVIYLDYYKSITRIDSDSDVLDEPHYRIYLPYLRYRIKKRRNKDLKAEEDDDFKSWVQKADAAIKKEYTGQDVRIAIDIP